MTALSWVHIGVWPEGWINNWAVTVAKLSSPSLNRPTTTGFASFRNRISVWILAAFASDEMIRTDSDISSHRDLCLKLKEKNNSEIRCVKTGLIYSRFFIILTLGLLIVLLS
jgi:hypothetical protein